MQVFKAKNVLNISAVESKPYDFTDDKGKNMKGTSICAVVTAEGVGGQLAVIKVKGKTVDEAQKKLESLKLVVGKPAEIPLRSPGAVAQLSV